MKKIIRMRMVSNRILTTISYLMVVIGLSSLYFILSNNMYSEKIMLFTICFYLFYIGVVFATIGFGIYLNRRTITINEKYYENKR